MKMKTAVKNYISEIKWRLIGLSGRLLIDLLCATMTIESDSLKKIKPVLGSGKFIFAFWHSRILLIAHLFKGWNGAILVSSSRDGEIIARILQSQGHETIRGSSSRGGLRALAKQIKILKKQQKPGAVIPDGPRGPRYKLQPGIIILAKKTGYPIIPCTYSAEKIKIFSSWDRFILPYPFTRCKVAYGDPVYVPETLDKSSYKFFENKLEKELCQLTDETDRSFNHIIK
jgi:lysophospholipid acyltransferase (LPLAT)-like uncharacterized protein